MAGMYSCSNCGYFMNQVLDRCPKCGLKIAGIMCNLCKRASPELDWIKNNHRCPKCNSIVQVPAASSYSTMTLKEAHRILDSLPRERFFTVSRISLAITALPFLVIAYLLSLLVPRLFGETDLFSKIVVAAIFSGVVNLFIYQLVKSVVNRYYKD